VWEITKLQSTLIFYFTGTGNSLFIAKALANELGNTEIIRIKGNMNVRNINEVSRIGFVFPVYYGGLPSLLSKLLSKLKNLQDLYIFAVVTWAGGYGRVFSQLEAELQQFGQRLAAGFHLKMPQNYIMAYRVPDKEEVNVIISKALNKIPQIADIVRNFEIFRQPADFPPYSGQSRRYQKFIAGVHESDSKFWCDETCTACEWCVMICPVGNIVLEERRPKWLHQCELCLACINWCPNRAIQYANRTSNKGRYTNPQVKIEELIT
jgi:ferredoxin